MTAPNGHFRGPATAPRPNNLIDRLTNRDAALLGFRTKINTVCLL
jgi:hypothetical protein